MAVPTQFSILAVDEVESAVSITASSEDASFPVERLQNGALFEAFRSAAAGSIQIDVDYGSVRPNRAVAFIGHNGQDADTWKIDLDDNASQSSPTTSGSVNLLPTPYTSMVDYTPSFGRNSVHIFSSDVSERYMRVTVDTTGNPAGFLRGSILAAGQLITPAVTIAPDISVTTYREGVKGFQRRGRRVSAKWELLTEQERASLLNMALAIGDVQRLLIIPTPSDQASFRDELVWCYLEDDPDFSEYIDNTFQASFSFKEALR